MTGNCRLCCAAAAFFSVHCAAQFWLATPSNAAVFTASVSGPGCPGLDSSPTGVVVSCDNGIAKSQPGSMGAKALSTSSRSISGVGSGSGNVQSLAIYNDTLYFSIDEGNLKIPISFTGNNAIDYLFNAESPTSQSEASARAFVRINNVVSAAFESKTIVYRENPENITTIEKTGQANVINELIVPFSGGFVSLGATLSANAGCSALMSRGSWCTSLSDFSSTLAFLAATVIDPQGVERDDVTITADSGFDYLAGYQMPAIPVPAGLPLAISAMSCLALLKAWGRPFRRKLARPGRQAT